VAHSCNPSYSGDRDQEDWGLSQSQEDSSGDHILKIFNTKKGWQSDSAVEHMASKCEALSSSLVLKNNHMEKKQSRISKGKREKSLRS
jgi:hypothetical protein